MKLEKVRLFWKIVFVFDPKLVCPPLLAVLPDLEQKFVIPDYVIEELKKDDEIWNNFEKMPELYKRIRISNMVEHKERDEETFNKKLENFKKKTKLNKLIHTNWHDNEKLLNY